MSTRTIRNLRDSSALAALLVAGACIAAGGAPSPKELAAKLQETWSSGNLEAAAALADLDGAPAEVHFAYLSQILDCQQAEVCTITTAPLDPEFQKQLEKDAAEIGADPVQAEGLIAIAVRSGKSSGSMKVPYAKSNGMYRIATLKPGPAGFAKLRGQSAEDQLKAMFAGGIYDRATGERRTDWATAATKLPADGGEAGKALVSQTAAMALAVDAQDPDAAMNSGSQWAKFVFAPRGDEGVESRQRRLHVQSLRMLRDVKISGGYQLGDDAALMVEARDGIGWISRGAVLMTREGDVWDMSGKQLVSFPP